jgi:hypothetical protein
VSRRFSQAFAADLLEVAVEGLAFGDDEVREGVVDLGELEVAALGNCMVRVQTSGFRRTVRCISSADLM